MQIQTSKFGPVQIDDERIVNFPKGLVGFPDCRRFALIQTNDQGVFFWLQSLDYADLAFIVCDPRTFVADYRIPIKSKELGLIGLSDPADAQVLVIVNKVDEMLTGNLQGPLVVSTRTLTATQLVLSDKRYTTRHPLIRLQREERLAMSKTA